MKRAVAVTAVLILLFLVQPLTQVAIVKANPIMRGIDGPILSIQSPNYYKAKIYPTTTIPISVVVYTLATYSKLTDLSYSLDGAANRTLSISNSQYIIFGTQCSSYTGTGILVNLSNGNHSLDVYALFAQGRALKVPTIFQVNTTYRYPTLLLSPLNTTYSKNEVPITYTINWQEGYVVDYWLDNSERTFLDGNVTLLGLSEGQHKIRIRATTSESLYSEQTKYFTIDASKQMALNDILIATMGIALGVVAIGSVIAVVYRRRKNSHES